MCLRQLWDNRLGLDLLLLILYSVIVNSSFHHYLGLLSLRFLLYMMADPADG